VESGDGLGVRDIAGRVAPAEMVLPNDQLQKGVAIL
jgi:hypothetical protein